LFLRPSREVNLIIRYCLALATHRFGVRVHAYCFLSNHYHLVATDCRGELPCFMHCLDLLLARALNALRGRSESFWSSGSYSAVELADPETVVEKIAYVLANPVSAGLVRAGRLWPGVISHPDDIGNDPLVAPRPSRFFRSAGTAALPAVVPLGLVPPPGLEHLSLDELRKQIAERVELHEMRARQRRGRKGFAGPRSVLRRPVLDRPTEAESSFGLNPRVAGRDGPARIAALARLAGFVQQYRYAWTKLQAGLRDLAVFPAGTWKIRREHGVPCEAPS
jgi:hypothetical protein